jgi:cytochrome c-type biogenesis protein CcmH/NrfG
VAQDPILAIAEHLAAIKMSVYAMLALVIAMTTVVSIRSWVYLRRALDKEFGEFFRREGQRLLETAKLDELVTLAREKIRERPNHAYAHWYLARAYYLQENWSGSLAEFKEVARIEPGWIEDHINPFVGAIERKTSGETVH